jgi:hypothetical protein
MFRNVGPFPSYAIFQPKRRFSLYVILVFRLFPKIGENVLSVLRDVSYESRSELDSTCKSVRILPKLAEMSSASRGHFETGMGFEEICTLTL